MTVPESTNRLLHEIKKALPYMDEQSIESIQVKWDHFEDAEIGEALKNLIKAIQEEG